MAVNFTFAWDPDRDPAIRPIRATLDRFVGWTDESQPDQLSSPSIDISDFADDMERFLEGLREGFPDGYSQEVRDDHVRSTLERLEADGVINDEGKSRLAEFRAFAAEQAASDAAFIDGHNPEGAAA